MHAILIIMSIFFIIDATLTRDSDPVEAPKRESKDTQPVKKVRTCIVCE